MLTTSVPHVVFAEKDWHCTHQGYLKFCALKWALYREAPAAVNRTVAPTSALSLGVCTRVFRPLRANARDESIITLVNFSLFKPSSRCWIPSIAALGFGSGSWCTVHGPAPIPQRRASTPTKTRREPIAFYGANHRKVICSWSLAHAPAPPPSLSPPGLSARAESRLPSAGVSAAVLAERKSVSLPPSHAPHAADPSSRYLPQLYPCHASFVTPEQHYQPSRYRDIVYEHDNTIVTQGFLASLLRTDLPPKANG